MKKQLLYTALIGSLTLPEIASASIQRSLLADFDDVKTPERQHPHKKNRIEDRERDLTKGAMILSLEEQAMEYLDQENFETALLASLLHANGEKDKLPDEDEYMQAARILSAVENKLEEIDNRELKRTIRASRKEIKKRKHTKKHKR